MYVTSPNLVCDKQESKEVEERDANGEETGYRSNQTLYIFCVIDYSVLHVALIM